MIETSWDNIKHYKHCGYLFLFKKCPKTTSWGKKGCWFELSYVKCSTPSIKKYAACTVDLIVIEIIMILICQVSMEILQFSGWPLALSNTQLTPPLQKHTHKQIFLGSPFIRSKIIRTCGSATSLSKQSKN